MINLLIFLAAIAVFLGIYLVIHHGFGFISLGRISAAAVVAGTTLLDQAQSLPWPSILDAAKAEMVAFGIGAGLVILHVYKLFIDALNPPAVVIAPVVIPPAPPAA